MKPFWRDLLIRVLLVFIEELIRARKLPGAAPYRGPIDPALLDRVLAEHRFDIAGLAWLPGFARSAPPGPRDG